MSEAAVIDISVEVHDRTVGGASSAESRVSKLESAMDRAQARIQKYEAQMQKMQSSIGGYEQKIQREQAAIEKHNAEMEKSYTTMAKHQAQITKLENSMKTSQESIDKNREALQKYKDQLAEVPEVASKFSKEISTLEKSIAKEEAALAKAPASIEKHNSAITKAQEAVKKHEAAVKTAGDKIAQYQHSMDKAKESVSQYGNSIKDTQEQIDRMKKDAKIAMVLDVKDKASSILKSVWEKGKDIAGKVWSVTVKAVDLVTAPLRGIFGGLKSLVGGVMNPIMQGMGISAGMGLGSLASGFIENAGRAETLNISMDAVAKSTETNTKLLNNQKKAVMDLGIVEQEATQIMTKFMQGELDIAQSSKLARVAQDAAVIAGTNSSDAAATMVDAVTSLSPTLLKQFGMTRNLNSIYQDYSEELGIVVKTTDKYGKTVRHMTRELDDAEKKQAMLNYILKEGEKLSGTYEKAMDSPYKKMGSLKRYWDTFSQSIGNSVFLPAFGRVIDGVTGLLKTGISWVDNNKTTLENWGQKLAGWVDGGIGKIKTLGSKVKEIFGSEDFKNADFFGKVKIAWDELIAKPFDDWYNSKGKDWLAEKANSIGKGLGMAVGGAIKGLLGLTDPDIIGEGKSIGSSFLQGFLEGFEPGKIWDALKGAYGNLWKSSPVMAGGLTMWGLNKMGGDKLLGGIGKTAFNALKQGDDGTGILSRLGGWMQEKSANSIFSGDVTILNGAASTTLKNGAVLKGTGGTLTTGLATIGKGLGAGTTTMAGSALAGGAAIGGIALGAASFITGISDLSKAVKSGNDNMGEKVAAGVKIGAPAVGAAIGTMIAPGIGTAIGAAVGGLVGFGTSGIVNMFSDEAARERAAEKLRETTKAYEEVSEKTKSAQKALDDYNEAQKRVAKGLSEYSPVEIENAKKIQQEAYDELMGMFPNILTQRGLENGKLQDRLDLVEENIKADQRLALTTLNNDITTGKLTFEKDSEDYAANKVKIDKLTAEETTRSDVYTELGDLSVLYNQAQEQYHEDGDQEKWGAAIGSINRQAKDVLEKAGIKMAWEWEEGFDKNLSNYKEMYIDRPEREKKGLETANGEIESRLQTLYNAESTKIKVEYDGDLEGDMTRLKEIPAEKEHWKGEIGKITEYQGLWNDEDLQNAIKGTDKLNGGIAKYKELKDEVSTMKQLPESMWDDDKINKLESVSKFFDPLLGKYEKFLEYQGEYGPNASEALGTAEGELKKLGEEEEALAKKLEPAVKKMQELNELFNMLPPGKTIPVNVVIGVLGEIGKLGAGSGSSGSGRFSNPAYDENGNVRKWANGGIVSSPHVGMMGEDGDEGIVPLSPKHRSRGLAVWQEVTKRLGIRQYAEGGIVGSSASIVAPQPLIQVPSSDDSDTPAISMPITIENNYEFSTGGSNANTENIVAIIRQNMGEIADDVAYRIASQLIKVYPNMPAKARVT